MEALVNDLFSALKAVTRQPRYALTAVLTVAIGIGATTAIFTVLKDVVLTPLPYNEPGTLVKLTFRDVHDEIPTRYVTSPDFNDLRAHARSFQSVAAYYDCRETGFELSGGDRPRRVRSMPVSARYFAALGCEPILGREFALADENSEQRSAVISHRLWQEQFAGVADVIGRSVRLDRQPWTVIGVLPAGFRDPFGASIDVWTPTDLTAGQSRDNYHLSVLGRLHHGVRLAEAQAELGTVTAAIDQDYPERGPWRFDLEPLHDAVVGSSETLLFVLFAAVAVVLLLACVNVANLTLARGMSRDKELAVLAALGCGRARLMRQLLMESLILSLLGGVVGLVLATGAVELLLATRPEALIRLDNVSLDLGVFGFAAGVALIAGVLSGVAPAFQLSRPNIDRALRSVSRAASRGVRHRRLRGTFVVVQTALAFILLVCATLLAQSFSALCRVDTGFSATNVLTFELGLPVAEYPVDEPSRRIDLCQQLDERLMALPGVDAAGATTRLPLTGTYHGWAYRVRSEVHPGQDEVWNLANVRVVSGDFFQALEIPLVRGRWLSRSDTADVPPVVLISRDLAERHFADRDAVGEQIRCSGMWWTVVGVVDNVRIDLRDENPDMIYIPYTQFADNRQWTLNHVVAGPGAVPELLSTIRRELATIDSNLVIHNESNMQCIVDRALASERFAALLMVGFAAVALVLVVVGIYGVMAYSVSQRRHEFGIRIALGAGTGQVLRRVLGEGLILTLAAIILGAVAAPALTRLLGTLVFEVSPTDIATFATVAAALGLVALVTCLIPGWQAASTNPMTLLREE